MQVRGGSKKVRQRILGFDDQIWNSHKLDIVVKGNIHKFNQNVNYAAYLVNTKDRILVEASPADKIWGIGLSISEENIDNPYFWNGQNLLGFALMEVRDFLVKFGHFKNLEMLLILRGKNIRISVRGICFGEWDMGKRLSLNLGNTTINFLIGTR